MPHSLGLAISAFRNDAGEWRDEAACGPNFYGEPIGGRTEHRRAGNQLRALTRLRRRAARDLHSQQTHRVMSGLVGLLALCGEVSGRRGAADIESLMDPHVGDPPGASECRPQAMLRSLGARPLHCAEAPHLYAILLNICVRAGMTRVPELFLLPCQGMNAYALGSPDNACISVTEGLLRGLSQEEIAGIFAHEIAHILHHDTGAMKWASAVQHEIARASQRGIVDLVLRDWNSSRLAPQALLLALAPAMARLLFFALSRVRELAADALALDLIDHPMALVQALCKLEYFHTGLSPLQAHLRQSHFRDDAMSFALRSHPGTWERISRLA
jgi:heat shock protein HtpX